MKKLAGIAIAVGLAAVVVISGFTVEAAKNSKKVSKSVTNADGKVGADDFIIKVNDVEIKMGDDLNFYIKDLGEPDDLIQARSCNYDGDDKVYTYGDVMLYTYTNGKEDILYSVEIIGETPTLSGIKVGSTKQEVITAYGKNYTDDGMYITYQYTENETIGFQIDKNVVTFIYMDVSVE